MKLRLEMGLIVKESRDDAARTFKSGLNAKSSTDSTYRGDMSDEATEFTIGRKDIVAFNNLFTYLLHGTFHQFHTSFHKCPPNHLFFFFSLFSYFLSRFQLLNKQKTD